MNEREIINDVTTIVLNDREYSAIIIGPEKSGIPRNVLQEERMKGMIIDGEDIKSFEWKGITKDQDNLYVYFDKIKLDPIERITTTYRDNALYLIREIAYGINKADAAFLNMPTGIFPLYRIYILDGDKILLLPPDMSDLIAIARMGERREKEANYLLKRNTEKGFTLIQEMTQLMYLAATGRLPYERKEVRTCDFTEIPLAWYEPNLDEKTNGFISFVLHAKEKQMREISGNRKAQVNLSWFLSRTGDLEWNLTCQTVSEREAKVKKTESTEEFSTYLKKIEKEAKRRDFWRVKGTLIVSLLAVGILVASILGTMLKAQLEPPYTRNMTQEEIVYDFFKNMNNQDPTALDNNAIKADIPQYNAILGLYISKQTRQAYEMMNPSVNLDSWLEEGKPAIAETSYIFGADIDSVSEIEENKFRASGTWYAPYRESDDLEIEAPEGYTVVYKYDVDEDFTFTWSKRGWWTVTDIEISKYNYIGYELVDVYRLQSAVERLVSNSAEESN